MNNYTSDISDNSDSDEGSWGELENSENDSNAKCLFCDSLFQNVELALSHCKESHGVDFFKLMNKFQMDCYSFIKMINFLRKESFSCDGLRNLDVPLWNDDSYLKPVEEFDPWLMFG